jgi:hypothetical protein
VDPKGSIPEKVLRLYLIEVKVPWGGEYKNESGEWTNTLNEVRRHEYAKYNKTIEAIQPYLKDKIYMARLTMERHIIGCIKSGFIRFTLWNINGKTTRFKSKENHRYMA